MMIGDKDGDEMPFIDEPDEAEDCESCQGTGIAFRGDPDGNCSHCGGTGLQRTKYTDEGWWD